MMKEILSSYLNNIAEITSRGDSREETYYPELKILFDQFGVNEGKNYHVTVLPKKTEAGNPDFRVWDGKTLIAGYIEAKPPDTNLDKIESSEQLSRYRQIFPNLILTDFYEFRLYRNGILVDQATIGRPFIAKTLKTIPPLEQEEKFKSILSKFHAFTLPRVYSAEELAIELAKRTRFLRDQVITEELREKEKSKGDIYGFYLAFQKYLIAGLTEKQFADLYSQTITYGLFAARTRNEGEFNRKLAYEYIPPTIGILRDIFRFISLGDLPQQMEVMIDDIAAILNSADTSRILKQYYVEGKGEDPIVHFYETFLAQYDPETREKRGVYYTPVPVVRYIVQSVDHLLRENFGLEDGLASREVTLLDPAAGTLTFPAEAIRLAVESFTDKYGEGGKSNLIHNQILNNYYALELMMAPYAIGHLKISILLEGLGCSLKEGERFKLYLTNTLEMEDIAQIDIPGLSALSEESRLAGNIKKKDSILVILGNPPYSGISANNNIWTEKLLKENIDGSQSYYTVDGQALGEKNPKWLQDDYVKFLRFAQWKIHKAGQGIVAMITNHGYLDNPTFRGMRQSLMNTFNEIYILNLHGNTLKRETTPDGGKDENVFDIRQGVAIALFVKRSSKSSFQMVHADLYGLRKNKYAWLITHNVDNTQYKEIKPNSPYYFFIPRSPIDNRIYLGWLKINEIFPVNSVGIVTARDNLTIGWNQRELYINVLNFCQMDEELARQAYGLGIDTRDWKVLLAQQDLKSNGGPHQDKIVPILYRPFDVRYTYYTGVSRGFLCMPRHDVMRHLIAGNNSALITARSNKSSEMDHFLITDKIMETKCGERTTQSAIFPLYILPSENQIELFSQNIIPNISLKVFDKLSKSYNIEPTPEEIQSYIYGIFYSNIYRKKYKEFLCIDFPRVPFTGNHSLFHQMSEYGKRLIDLHLLKSQELDNSSIKYQGIGQDNRIEYLRYKLEDNRLYINKDKYFDDISPEMWDYQIGGYKVLQKYLKDRKGRLMEDPRHYIHIATAINKTIELQTEIDNIYIKIEETLIDFQ